MAAMVTEDAAASGARPFTYPAGVNSESSRTQHKLRIQRESPETLFADCNQSQGKSVTTNLLLYTEQTAAWHTAVCAHYPHFTKRGICKGRQILTFTNEEKDPENRCLTINMYQNGTIMVQGSEAALSSFERDFSTLKKLSETEKIKNASTPLIPGPEKLNSHNEPGKEKTTPVCNSGDIDQDPQTQAQHLHSTVEQVRDSLSLLEVELTELKEQVLTHITCNTEAQFLKDQLSQVRNQLKLSVGKLKGEVETLQADKEEVKRELAEEKQGMRKELAEIREELRRELSGVREQLQVRDKAIESLKEQLQSLTAPATAPAPTLAHTDPAPVHTDPAPVHTDTLTPSQSQPSQENKTPVTQSVPQTKDKNTPPLKTATPELTHPRAHTATQKATEVAILIDSNGKFINEEQLFPGMKVSKIWCPRAKDALHILSRPDFGSPKHIVIHTGT